jgi:hypothetical protein
MELGDAIGDMVFGMSELGKEATKIEQRQGGRTKSRNADTQVLNALSEGRRGGLQQLQDRIRGVGGGKLLRQLEKNSAVTNQLAKDFLAQERKLKNSEEVFRKTAEEVAERNEKAAKKETKKKDDRARRLEAARKVEAGRIREQKRLAKLRETLDPEQDAISDKELISLIQRAGAQGQSLNDVLGGRKLATTGPPPVITVTVTNNNIEQNIDAPVTVNGATSDSAEDLARLVEDTQRRVFREEVRGAIEELQPVEAR